MVKVNAFAGGSLRFINVVICLLAFVVSSSAFSFQHVQSQNTGVISGRVTLRGNGVPGVMVIVLASNKTRQWSTLTDSEGHYEISGVPPIEGLITIANASYVLVDGIGGVFQQVQIKNTATVQDLEVIEGGVITGCVEYKSKQPLVEHEVVYERTDPPIQGFSAVSFRPSVATNDEGCFRLYGLPRGHYHVGIGKPRSITEATLPLPFPVFFFEEQNAIRVVEVQSGSVADLGRLSIDHDFKVSRLAGVFIDKTSGEAIPRFPFDLVRVDEKRLTATSRFTTDENGRFAIDDLFTGAYRLQPAIRSTERRGYTFAPLSFQVGEKEVSRLVVECNSQTVSIHGSVVINGSLAASSQDCTIALKKGTQIETASGNIFRASLKNGKFSLTDIERGVYTLVVMPLRPSLQLREVHIGDEVLHNSGPFGLLQIDLTSDKNVRILLADNK